MWPEYFLVPTSSVNTSNQTRHAWSGHLLEDQGASSNGNNYIKQANPPTKELTEMQAIQGTTTLRTVISDRMTEEPFCVESVGNSSYPLPASTYPIPNGHPAVELAVVTERASGVGGMRVFPVLLTVS